MNKHNPNEQDRMNEYTKPPWPSLTLPQAQSNQAKQKVHTPHKLS